jgi:TRAP-type mannitol/chloroaromatic compound transport system permease small subunit
VDLRRRQHDVQHAVVLCGAYTLAQSAHVRGDFLYSSMRPRMQASLDIVLYVLFFPGSAAPICAGWDYASISWRMPRPERHAREGPAGHPQDHHPDRQRG